MGEFTQQQRTNAAAKGQAMKGGRFPIRNAGDLANAIRAVGRVKPATEEARAAVRRHIIKRARALNLAKQIPDSWNSDGTLKTST